MQEFLAANRPGAARLFCILVAIDPARDGAVVGGSVFSYVARSNCGFSEYMLADERVRGTGIGRLLFDARKEVLDTEARRLGHDACRGVFIEVDHPDRVPADVAALEHETALDGWERLRLFDHLGFRRVDIAYVQPPLAPDKQPIDYMDLLFAPWQAQAAASARIPTRWMLDTLEAIWSAWTPATAASYFERFERRISGAEVALQPAYTKAS
jgi:GNAT superfamily N-acetyltransferase